ncbi:hypothetical protein CMS1265 [Clavibacter sepedonicus]|uniref:Uncharacterized protein n=1 Tax=Clavibacter sepedonicus TaxID=31964 RepID=B0RHG4_CLASE|nr:hypothetical protein CMS1265 [Clavibacter sepedonicus]
MGVKGARAPIPAPRVTPPILRSQRWRSRSLARGEGHVRGVPRELALPKPQDGNSWRGEARRSAGELRIRMHLGINPGDKKKRAD